MRAWFVSAWMRKTAGLSAGCLALLAWWAVAAAAAQRVLVVGIYGSALSGWNPRAAAWGGPIPDFLASLAKDDGLRIDLRPMQFYELIPALVSGRIDVVATNFVPTAERRAVVDFSDPCFSYRDVAIVAAGDPPKLASVADFKGLRVAVKRDSPFIEKLEQAGAAVIEAAGIEPVLPDVASGEVDAVVSTGPNAVEALRRAPDPGLAIISSYPALLVASVRLMVRHGDAALLADLDREIAKLRADGAEDALAAKWGLLGSR